MNIWCLWTSRWSWWIWDCLSREIIAYTELCYTSTPDGICLDIRNAIPDPFNFLVCPRLVPCELLLKTTVAVLFIMLPILVILGMVNIPQWDSFSSMMMCRSNSPYCPRLFRAYLRADPIIEASHISIESRDQESGSIWNIVWRQTVPTARNIRCCLGWARTFFDLHPGVGPLEKKAWCFEYLVAT